MKTGRKTWVRTRHRAVRDIVYFPVKLVFFLLYGLRTEKFPAGRRSKQAYLILSNHTTPLDPVCLGLSFGFPIYYVASDHILRQGWVSRLLQWCFAPIPIVKSKLDLRTIKEIMTVASEGGSVSIFPEGNRNYNGETAPFAPAVSKLAKALGIPLVLYRFDGGYLTAPRWADTIRRGRMAGSAVRVVSPEEMKALTVGELHALVKRELYLNAFDVQEKRPVRYRGKWLAEFLERALYLCPRCRGMAAMRSRGDILSCSCGLKVRYNEFGFFEAADASEASPHFKTALEWDRWQKGYLPQWLGERMGALRAGEALIADGGQRLYACGRAGENRLVGTGRFALYADRFAFEGGGAPRGFPLDAIVKVIIHGKQTLQFTLGDDSTYEVRSPFPRSALKYLNLCELLKNEDRGERYGLFSL
jgi:1-acyl-sn-glycerol-3-phosphate acyltransferase